MLVQPSSNGVGRAFRGLVLCLAAIAAVTAAVYALRSVAPVLSLGSLYVIAVVVAAVARGLAFAIPVSVVSMLTFNFLFLPPAHTLAVHDSSQWVALGVYIAIAVVVSELATRSRRFASKAVEAETLRQSDAVKTAVLRSVSHDFRSPITAIRAAGDGLASSELTLSADDRRDLIETVVAEARRLERLVENLLDLSRLESGTTHSHAELWTVDSLVARALDHLSAPAARVSVTVDPDVPTVRVDAAQIERALANVVENALKYSPPSGPVNIAVARSGSEVHVRIRDEGSGVPDALRERIFDAFERGADGVRGSGLGLAIARGFTEANRGGVTLEPSRAGDGATFVVSLPAAVKDDAVRA